MCCAAAVCNRARKAQAAAKMHAIIKNRNLREESFAVMKSGL
jgi:hypothetical protein